MTSWVFQGNPDKFDIDEYLRRTSTIQWMVLQKHLAPEMAVGDEVFMWRAGGKRKEQAGIIAAGRISVAPSVMADDDASDGLWRETPPGSALRVLVELHRIASGRREVVQREWLMQDPVASTLRILSFQSETNYRLSEEQAGRLRLLVQNTGRDWTREESLAGLWAYVVTRGGSVSRSPGSPVALVSEVIGRAVTGVYNKVMNFRALDPTDDRVGLPAGSATDKEVWDEFFDPTSGVVDVERLQSEFDGIWRSARKLERGPVGALGGGSPTIDVPEFAQRLNQLARSYRIGELQELRKTLHGFKRRPGSALFGTATVHEDYAHHHGGRTELQFNIGLEPGGVFRWGVAFSLELSQTLPSIDVLIPKIARFNEFLAIAGESVADFRMWHFSEHERSPDMFPGPIPPEIVRPGVFVCLGKTMLRGDPRPDEVLADFDRLLPLYEFVEGSGDYPTIDLPTGGFEFRPGHSRKRSRTRGTSPAQSLDIDLRHNVLEDTLVESLRDEFGEVAVGSELPTGNGRRADVVVKRGQEVWLYEIKLGISARSCIVQALGQLIEYAYWPVGIGPDHLVVAGEPPLDPVASDFLSGIREEFGLPISYRQIVVKE